MLANRSPWLALNMFGLGLRATDDEEYDLVIQRATGKIDVDGIRAWLATRVVLNGERQTGRGSKRQKFRGSQ